MRPIGPIGMLLICVSILVIVGTLTSRLQSLERKVEAQAQHIHTLEISLNYAIDKAAHK